jgi:large subunit ribosomal protein L5
MTEQVVAEKKLTRLDAKYREEIAAQLLERFQYGNKMRIPKLEKIVLNMGVGRATQNKKLLEGAVADLTRIAGLKPVVTHARKSISNFKLREGMPIGCMVTLRGDRMYEFLDKLIGVAIPRIRDFRGIPSKSFDGRGNYTLGITEQIIFPEIDFDKVDEVRGLDITFVTTAKTDEEGRELLTRLGMPFRK